MANLLESLKDNKTLEKMLEVTQYIRETVPFEDRIIVSETINGRSYRQFRSGLIYLSYDMNQVPKGKVFAELSLHFATYGEKKVGILIGVSRQPIFVMKL